MWRFERIPPEEQDQVLIAWEQQDLKTIFTIYQKRKVAPERISPCCATKLVMEWTEYAIKNGLIVASDTSTS